MSDRQTDPAFWQRKLMAYLHDAPDKCFDIAHHACGAAAVQKGAAFIDDADRAELETSVKPADWFSASSERFVFPKVKCSHNFTADPRFIHPLSSVAYPFPEGFTQRAGVLSEALQSAVGGIESDDWHAKFFLYWRRWLDNAMLSERLSADDRVALAFLPADTRIPDHTIWNHMAVVSGLVPCIKGNDVAPELLLFQLGPVQEFIAQARSTRDLWSGSYLISWLMAHAMKAVTDEIGPDVVIFPSLRGNGIFDALHKDTFYAARWQSGDGHAAETTWERLLQDKGGSDGMADWLLTPTLPNRFLAIVPPGEGAALAARATAAIHAELATIGQAVWEWLAKNGCKTEWRARWDAQIAAFPQTAWAVQPWLDREACLAEAGKLPHDAEDPEGVAARIQAMLDIGEKHLPLDDRDRRYYTNDSKASLRNPGLLWSAHYALLDAKLAARRNTRDFTQWDPVETTAAVKDSLSGKEECIGDEKFWKGLAQNALFSKAKGHRYGAMNLIKRLWCRPEIPYLARKLGLSSGVISQALRVDSTQEIADRNVRQRHSESGVLSSASSPYIALLAIDGDQMGKWVSGAKTPAWMEQLAPRAQDYLATKMWQSRTDLPQSEIENLKSQILKVHRLLTPSYHLQFSEALANFAIYQARAVVEQFDGELIYAGGDDVLAILPATRAIACAQALRAAFRTDFEKGRLYPGSQCDLSCGIAVGHFQAPLQMLVKEAQKAEHLAKHTYGRAALAVSLYKRSGEIIAWGCKWNSPALPLMARITELTESGKLSGRFPYALAALLQPYALEDEKDAAKLKANLKAMQPVVRAEVRHVLSRQGATLTAEARTALAVEIDHYLEACWNPPWIASGVLRPASSVTAAQPKDSGPRPQDAAHQAVPRPLDFLNLFLAETFINRHRGEE